MMKRQKEISRGKKLLADASVDEGSPAVTSTILSTTMGNMVQLPMADYMTANKPIGRTPSITKLEVTLILARYPVNFCPTLMISSIGMQCKCARCG